MEKTANLYSLSLAGGRAWLMAAVFTVAGIALPQLCHLIPRGGLIFLPIYFFTLVAAYKYGLGVGLTVAVLTPLVNHLLFGMPGEGALVPILIKGVTLAAAASGAARLWGRVSLVALICAVAACQIVGTGAEWAIEGGGFVEATQDFRLGLPGIMLQIFGGWLVLRALRRF
jgi:hypothetical protein